MSNIINKAYNNLAVARVGNDNIVHNHLYHDCKIGHVNTNVVYDNNNNIVGKVDDRGFVYCVSDDLTPIGRVDDNGYIYKRSATEENVLVGRIDFTDSCQKLAGASFLLLVDENR